MYEKEQLREIPIQKPLTNILSSVEDLKLASVKIDKLQGMIDNKENSLNISRYSLLLGEVLYQLL
jgi:hypothetical protein